MMVLSRNSFAAILFHLDNEYLDRYCQTSAGAKKRIASVKEKMNVEDRQTKE
jgi:hypothetical protein